MKRSPPAASLSRFGRVYVSAVTTCIRVPHVIGKDNHEVWLTIALLAEGRCNGRAAKDLRNVLRLSHSSSCVLTHDAWIVLDNSIFLSAIL